MSEHANPSSDPADDDSLAGTLRAAFRKFLQQTDDCLPARVLAFDRATNRATVVPCVTVLTTDGRAVQRASVASVPVFQLGGGGVVLNFNLQPGDFGWLKASDRDVSLFFQGFNTGPPNTLRLHSFQDAVFLPDVMRGWTIAGEDADNAVLQNLAGDSRVSVGDTWVKLTHSGHTVKLDAAGVRLASGDNYLAVTPAGLTIHGPVTMTGGVTMDGIAFGTHVHSDPQGSNTGGPE